MFASLRRVRSPEYTENSYNVTTRRQKPNVKKGKGFKWQTQVSNLEVKDKREKFFSPNLPRPQISTVRKEGAGLLVIITDKSRPPKAI